MQSVMNLRQDSFFSLQNAICSDTQLTITHSLLSEWAPYRPGQNWTFHHIDQLCVLAAHSGQVQQNSLHPLYRQVCRLFELTTLLGLFTARKNIHANAKLKKTKTGNHFSLRFRLFFNVLFMCLLIFKEKK